MADTVGPSWRVGWLRALWRSIQNRWRQGMTGGADQIVPYAGSGPRAEDVPGFPRGMPTTQADTINADLLAFIES